MTSIILNLYYICGTINLQMKMLSFDNKLISHTHCNKLKYNIKGLWAAKLISSFSLSYLSCVKEETNQSMERINELIYLFLSLPFPVLGFFFFFLLSLWARHIYEVWGKITFSHQGQSAFSWTAFLVEKNKSLWRELQ